MTVNQLSDQDFERAVTKSFWRRLISRLRGESNELLPFDEVRDMLRIQGQHYIGLRQVPIEQIVGSVGRYNDFDRVFLPTQRRTKDRWVNIDRAHYEHVALPPVDLYKIGEIYFVKDGNHRISVARERGQEFVDAYVTEIDIPIMLTSDTKVDDLALKKELADFILETRLTKIRPSAQVEVTIPEFYNRIQEHIAVHQWYLGEQLGEEVAYKDAVASWYDNVYTPVMDVICDQRLLKSFPGSSEADLYLWIMEFAGYFRQAYQEEDLDDRLSKEDAAKQLASDYPLPAVKKLIQIAKKHDWIKDLILNQERAQFFETTKIDKLRPDSDIEVTLPGQYDQLREHIAVHRWYLGEHRQADVPRNEAVISWYDNVYLPIVDIIRDQNVLEGFPKRKETDLYLWIMNRKSTLENAYATDVSIEQAFERLTEDKKDKSDGIIGTDKKATRGKSKKEQ